MRHALFLDRWSSGYGLIAAKDLRRVQRTAGGIFALLGAYSIALATALALDIAYAVVPFCVVLAGLSICATLLRVGVTIGLVANAVVGLNAIVLLGMLVASGGSSIAAVIGLPAVVALALLLVHRRAMLLWSAMAVATLTAVMLLSGIAFSFPLDASETASETVLPASIILLGLLCWINWLKEGDQLRSESALSQTLDREQAISQRLLEAQEQHLETELERVRVLAGGVAHDFNNLLTVIMGNTEFLQEEQKSAFVDSGELDAIELATGHAADLAAQLLDFAGSTQPIFNAVDASAIARESVGIARWKASSDLVIELQVGRGPWWIEGDRSRIQRVLMNLILNAGES